MRPATDPDWRWQLRHSLRDMESLRRRFPDAVLSPRSEGAARRFPMAITPYYADLVRTPELSDPIFAQCVPRGDELDDPAWLADDPLDEEMHSPVSGLIHRYPDRALLLATASCAVYCRHCMRKRVAGCVDRPPLAGAALRACTDYLSSHSEVTDVLISGGDPLMLGTPALERLLRAVRAVPSVEIIRIATRVPATLPMRVDAELATMLRRYAPVYVNTHFNHPVELTPQAGAALATLADAGLPLGNQTVLLRGVNDSPATIEALCRALLRHRVRPYYLFQCDLVRGVEHFRTPLDTGLEIMRHLRGRLSGLGIPHFAVDTPRGGKVELLPEVIVRRDRDYTVLRNPAGREIRYPEPRRT
jgi:lysine 2,3-aminomutase